MHPANATSIGREQPAMHSSNVVLPAPFERPDQAEDLTGEDTKDMSASTR